MPAFAEILGAILAAATEHGGSEDAPPPYAAQLAMFSVLDDEVEFAGERCIRGDPPPGWVLVRTGKRGGKYYSRDQKKIDDLREASVLLKAQRPEMIPLLRDKDTYHAFGPDAEKAATALGVKLPSDGHLQFLHSDLQKNLGTMLKAGLRVAIADQIDKVPLDDKGKPVPVEKTVVESPLVGGDKRDTKVLATYPSASGGERKYTIEKHGDEYQIKYTNAETGENGTIDQPVKTHAAAVKSLGEHLERLPGYAGPATIHDPTVQKVHDDVKTAKVDAAKKKEGEIKLMSDRAEQARMKEQENKVAVDKIVAKVPKKRNQTATIKLESGDKEVKGVKVGEHFIVHKSDGAPSRYNQKYTVTHVPSGLKATGANSQEEAIRAASLMAMHGDWSKAKPSKDTLAHGAKIALIHNRVTGPYRSSDEFPSTDYLDHLQTSAKALPANFSRFLLPSLADVLAHTSLVEFYHNVRDARGRFAKGGGVADALAGKSKIDKALAMPAPEGGFGGPNQPYWRPGPNPTVDTVMTRDHPETGQKQVLLIQRKEGTAEGGKWALPGGFHDSDAKKGEPWKPGKETAKQAALREVAEETGLSAEAMANGLKKTGVYEGGGRDPRDNAQAWSKSTAFQIHLSPAQAKKHDAVKGSDDASKAEWVDVSKLGSIPLAFDHAKILKDAGIKVPGGTPKSPKPPTPAEAKGFLARTMDAVSRVSTKILDKVKSAAFAVHDKLVDTFGPKGAKTILGAAAGIAAAGVATAATVAMVPAHIITDLFHQVSTNAMHLANLVHMPGFLPSGAQTGDLVDPMKLAGPHLKTLAGKVKAKIARSKKAEMSDDDHGLTDEQIYKEALKFIAAIQDAWDEAKAA